MNIEALKTINEFGCKCGREHTFNSSVFMGEGAIDKLGEVTEKFAVKKAFILADINTYPIAGEAVCNLLCKQNIEISKYIFQSPSLEPDEKSVGLAIMNFDPSCDIIIATGSGVINDIGKIVASASSKPYIIVATAPSMDGYASSTSSMTMNGVKISLPSKCADVIIGDTDILCTAPIKMMLSGLGDMLAKYVSICEWRLSNLINGEYYCPEIAELVRQALKKCTDNAQLLLKKDKNAVNSVFEGLTICGIAMKLAGASRPASGVEHYISHIWDMRNAEFSTPIDFHGIQCAIGTLEAVKLYEKLTATTPDKEKALTYVKNFDYTSYAKELKDFLGKSAESLIMLEGKEKKYDKEAHEKRLCKIIESYDEILCIIKDELPSYEWLEELFDKLNLPKTPEDIGISSEILPMTFKATKDIRDKYVLSRLCWDLGIIDEII